MAERGPAPPEWVVAPSEGWVAPKGLTPDGRVLASQGRRVLAYLIDYGIWMVPNAIIGVLLVAAFVSSLSETDDFSELNVPVVVGLYALLFVLGLVRLALEAEKLAHRGQTWGMRAMGLRAVDARNGGSITRGRAWARTAFALWISSQLFGIGYWWAFFDDRRRSLHDLVCGTVVIDER